MERMKTKEAADLLNHAIAELTTISTVSAGLEAHGIVGDAVRDLRRFRDEWFVPNRKHRSGPRKETPKDIEEVGGLTSTEWSELRAGRFIDTIRMVRERTGLGLKESKERVDEARESLARSLPGRFA